MPGTVQNDAGVQPIHPERMGRQRMRPYSLKPLADRASDGNSIIQFTRENPTAWLGLSSLFLWTWAYFQDSFIYSEIGSSSASSISMPWAIIVISFVVVFFTMGFVSRRVDFSFQHRKLLTVVALAMCASIVMVNLGQTAESGPGAIVFVAGLIMLGAATPILYIEIVRIFLNFGFKSILFSTILASAFAVTFYLMLSLLPHSLSWPCTLAIPLLMLFCLLRSFRKYGVIEQMPQIVDGPTYIPWRLLLTSFFQGTAFSMAQTYLVNAAATDATAGEALVLVCLVGFLAAALVMLVVIIYFRPDFDSLIYKLGFVCLSFGLLLISIAQLRGVGFFLNAFGHRFIDCLIWALVIYLTQSKRVSLNWIAAWPTAALYFGMSVGFLLVTNASNGLLGLSAAQIFSVLAVVVLTAAIAFTSSRNIITGWGSIRVSGGALERTFSPQALENIQTRFEFSPRQRDVFALLCKGCARREIATQLFLSDETVKVHIHNIYQKTAVHSRQDLLGLIEAEDRLLRR